MQRLTLDTRLQWGQKPSIDDARLHLQTAAQVRVGRMQIRVPIRTAETEAASARPGAAGFPVRPVKKEEHRTRTRVSGGACDLEPPSFFHVPSVGGILPLTSPNAPVTRFNHSIALKDPDKTQTSAHDAGHLANAREPAGELQQRQAIAPRHRQPAACPQPGSVRR